MRKLPASRNSARTLGAEMLESRQMLAYTALPLGGPNPSSLTPAGDLIYFLGQDSRGTELWRTDGTASGTLLLADIVPGSGSPGIANMTVVGSNLFFTATTAANGQELWVSDGTPTGTRLVKDIYPVAGNSLPSFLTPLGSTLIFSATTPDNGVELWRSDGTADGTYILNDNYPGAGNSLPSGITVAGSYALFTATSPTTGQELWRTDGTAVGTFLLNDIYPGPASSLVSDIHVGAGYAIFNARSLTAGMELWRTDGTESGTFRFPGLNALGFTPFKNSFVFQGSNPSTGYEPWITDGTSDGTRQIRDIMLGPFSSLGGEISFFEYDGYMYFEALSLGQIWRTNGTELGTNEIGNLFRPDWSSAGVIAGVLYFQASTIGGAGAELIRTDGTPIGTYLVSDIELGIGSSAPANLTVIGDRLFFTADNSGSRGRELWVSDGTNAGTQLVRDIVLGPESPGIRAMKGVASYLYFTTNDGFMWSSDGTYSGTSQVTSPLFPQGVQFDRWVTGVDHENWFVGFTPDTGAEVFQVDGSGNAITLLVDLFPGSSSSEPNSITHFKGDIVAVANGPQGRQLHLISETSPPTAEANGPYIINEGGSLSLTASGSFDPQGDPLSYTWDLNNDGNYGDATGAAPTLTWAQLGALSPPINDNGSFTVRLRVDDGKGNVATDTATLLINNVNPQIGSITIPSAGEPNQSLLFTASASDVAGASDPLTFTWNFGDGSSNASGIGLNSVSHSYAIGSYTVTLTVTDGDGGSVATTRAITISPAAPTPPTGLDASDAIFTDRVRLTWNGVANATSYEVWRNTSNDPNGATRIAQNVTLASYDDFSAGANQPYYYWVSARNVTGVSGFSVSNLGSRAATVPAPPLSVGGSDGAFADKVRVTWSPSAGATGYEVWRNSVNDPDTAQRLTANDNESPYDDTSAAPAQVYWYWVTAKSALGTSLFSSSDAGYRNLDAPSGLNATDGTFTDRVTLSWGTVVGATSYTVLRSTTGNIDNAAVIANGLPTGSYIDNSAVQGQIYTYWVRAVSSLTTSASSLPNTGFAAIPAPVAPTSVVASDASFINAIRVTWNASANATSYEVWRNTSASTASAVQLASNVTTTFFDDTTAGQGVQFYYWIVARNATGASPFSGADTGYLLVPTPGDILATDGTDATAVHVSWGSVAGATSYLVYRSTGTDPNGAQQVSVQSTTVFSDTTAPTGVSYTYWVRAANAVSTSAFGAGNGGFRRTPAPLNVVASDGTSTSTITVTWSSVAGATQYQVLRNVTSNPSSATQVAILNSTAYVDTTAVVGQTYYYWVKASNSLSVSDLSVVDTGFRSGSVPNAPTGTSASDGAFTDRVRVSWGATLNTDSYDVARNTINSAVGAVVIATTANTTYDDTSGLAGTSYFYFVRSRNTAGVSEYGTADAGYRSIPVPSAPGNVQASDGSFTDRIRVTWAATPSATSYEVWRSGSNSSAGAARIAANVVSTSYDDQTVVPGIYFYFVKGVNVSGASPFSGANAGFLSLTGPGVPGNVAASDGAFVDKVRITWSASANSTSYQVWRAGVNDVSQAVNVSGTISGLQFDDTTASPGQTNYYWVRGQNLLGVGPFSTAEAGFRNTQVILVGSGQVLGTYNTNDLLLGDLDGDGDLDAYQANEAQGDRVYFNNGQGIFTDSGQSLGNFQSIYGDLGDVDGDGDLDAIIAAIDKSVVWLNNGQGIFTDSGQRLVAEIPIDAELGDFDGDGDLDAFITSAQSNAIWHDTIWLNNGSGQFVDSGQRLPGADSRTVRLADLEGDGDLDAFVANRNSDLANRVWINDGQANFSDSGLRLGNSQTQTVAVGDLNGDGHLDLFEANVTNGPNRVMLNNGNGTFAATNQLLGDDATTDVVLGDMDGDGDLDAVVSNYYEDGVLYLNDGTGRFSDVQQIPNFNGQRVALGDLDGDGDLDLFQGNYGSRSEIYFNITQRPYVTQMVRNNGDQRYDRLTTLTFTFSEDVLATVSAADLTLFNTRTNTSINTAGVTTSLTGVPNQIRFNLGSLSLDHGLYFVALRGIGISNSYGTPLDGNQDGVAGDDYQTTVRIAQLGDVNLDGSVDASDAGEMFANWGGSGGTWASGDVNLDGIIDAADAGEMFAFWTGDSGPARKRTAVLDRIFGDDGDGIE